MKPVQISSWKKFEVMNNELQNETIRSWLLEDGPITDRIKLKNKFKLKLLKDEVSNIDSSDEDFLGNISGCVKVREVILMADNVPKVFARSLIPEITIEHGLSKLGSLGSTPLGDILFEKEIFKKIEVLFSKFIVNKEIFWGRKTKYSVKNLPISVMEVFLVN